MALKKGNETARAEMAQETTTTAAPDEETLRRQQEDDRAREEELRLEQEKRAEQERKDREAEEQASREKAQQAQREQDKRDADAAAENLRREAEARGVTEDLDENKFVEVTNNTEVDFRQPSTNLWISAGETKDLRNDGWLENQVKARLLSKTSKKG